MKNLTNEQICNAFARGENNHTNKGGSLFIEDFIIYSYGYHYPMAKHYGTITLINENSYSATTSKQRSLLTRELSYNNIIYVPDVLCENHETNVKYLEEQVKYWQLKAKRATKHNYESFVVKAIENLEKYKSEVM